MHTPRIVPLKYIDLNQIAMLPYSSTGRTVV